MCVCVCVYVCVCACVLHITHTYQNAQTHTNTQIISGEGVDHAEEAKGLQVFSFVLLFSFVLSSFSFISS